MRSPRNQLILLGFICQGLSWDDYYLPLLNLLLWVLGLSLAPKKIQIGPFVETVLLLGGCAAGYWLGLAFDRSIHFFIGHGLTLLQAARLLRPLNQREKFFSVLIALFQLGVACTFVFDLRFILLLAAAVVLIPRTLQELAAESFSTGPAPALARLNLGRRLGIYLFILATTVLFFVGFPRVFLGAQIAPRRSTQADLENVLDSVLDPTRGALSGSSKVLLEIQGENLGYLRCLSLTEIKGAQWTLPNNRPTKRLPYVWPLSPQLHLYRRVRVRNASYLAHILPTDGQVVNLGGNFFWRPAQNNHGGIPCEAMWNTANNTYQYWINRRPVPEPPFRGLLRSYTNYPPQSQRIWAWLDHVLVGVTNPLAQARTLESHFRNKFTYELGAPKLARLAPTEDFLFHQQRGHCERFAATLGLLLRMKGIPSRVVIGYVPTSRNLLRDGYNIRFKDAHAWTEAYFPDAGWVELDATPRATAGAGNWSVGDFLADLDVAWSSYVVNFDAPMQSQFFKDAVQGGLNAASWVWKRRLGCLALLALPLAVLAWRAWRRRKPAGQESVATGQRASLLAEHYYGQMLKALESQGLFRELPQTPFEFLRRVKPRVQPAAAEVELITELFCATRYGLRSISGAQQQQIQLALARIRRLELAGAKSK